MSRFRQGDIVKISRDEKLYPPRGTWPKYRNRVGTVVNPCTQGEVGVAFQRTWRDEDNKLKWQGSDTTWFMPYELVKLDPVAARAMGCHPDDS